MNKSLLFLIAMFVITVVPLVLILLVVMAMKSWMSRKHGPSRPDEGPDSTAEGR